MDFVNFLATSTVIGFVVAVLAVTVWITAIVAFFSMATNISRLRRDVETLQDIATIQHHWLEQERNARMGGRNAPETGQIG